MVENLEDLKSWAKKWNTSQRKMTKKKLINRMIHQSLQIHKD